MSWTLVVLFFHFWGGLPDRKIVGTFDTEAQCAQAQAMEQKHFPPYYQFICVKAAP